MSSDLPDYRREIVIVESVELNVVGEATVDLTHVGGVEIATPTVEACVPVSIENDAIAYDGTSDRFKMVVESWTAAETVDVEIQNATLAVTQSGTWTVAISGSVTVTGAVAATQSGTWNIATLTTITNTVDVNIESQTADVDVNITNASIAVTGTVSISGTVTISGAVTVTSGAVTISTAAADNVLIDKLTQGAYTDRQPTLSNNGVTPIWDSQAGNTRRGKYFPRGCRGFLDTIEVYCKDIGASGGTITVYVAPNFKANYLFSSTITVSAGGAASWRGAVFKEFWNYDSMFIYFKGSSTDIHAAYDTGTPYDAYDSGDAGVTWTFGTNRKWARANLTGATVGDVPIAGTVSINDRSAYNYAHCTADTQVKASAGRIHTVTINSCTTAGVLTIYDNTAESGTVIAAIVIPINAIPVTLTYDVLCSTGIYAGFDGTLAADITVSYI